MELRAMALKWVAMTEYLIKYGDKGRYYEHVHEILRSVFDEGGDFGGMLESEPERTLTALIGPIDVLLDLIGPLEEDGTPTLIQIREKVLGMMIQ